MGLHEGVGVRPGDGDAEPLAGLDVGRPIEPADMTEMVDIKAASQSYESAVEASNTAKRLLNRTIEMLQK